MLTDLAPIIASLLALAGVGFQLLSNRKTVETEVEKTARESELGRAQTLQVYWARIDALEHENHALRQEILETEARYERKIKDLQAENQSLWAEIGKLKASLGGKSAP